MKERGKWIWFSAAVTALVFVCTAMLAIAAAQGEKTAEVPVLTNDDCIMCHTQEPADIDRAGSAHKTAIGCQDCHVGHPPKVKEGVIPQCSMCHEGEAHFEVEACLRCHSNPHTPLELTLGKKETKVCLTCHETEGQQLQAHKSVHTTLACTDCHNSREHGVIPECLQCHKPHAPDMTQQECSKCHQAHMPLVVTYPDDIASADCGACHGKEFQLLAKSPAKHHDLSCAECHADKHKTVPRCQQCHGEEPHPKGILSKFPGCASCHNDPHDLNNWSSSGKGKKKGR
jgi:predicted CXXCH cytochrome family protein